MKETDDFPKLSMVRGQILPVIKQEICCIAVMLLRTKLRREDEPRDRWQFEVRYLSSV